MGWWETQDGTVIGDPALDVLEEHAGSTHWKTTNDIPLEVITAIAEAYSDGVGREPTPAELKTLLIYHRGNTRNSEPGPSDP